MCTPDAAPCNNYTLYKIVSPVRSRLRFIVPNNLRLECRENYAGELPASQPTAAAAAASLSLPLLPVRLQEETAAATAAHLPAEMVEEFCGDRKSMDSLRAFRNRDVFIRYSMVNNSSMMQKNV